MIVETPDGQVQFPDSMSTDDIQNVLRQKYGFKGGAQGAPAPAAAQGSPTPSSSATSAPISPAAPGGAGQGPPASGGSIFTRVAADQPASFNQPDSLGQTSALNKPSDASWNDFMLAHLAELGKGGGQMGQAAADYARVAGNTFGLYDRAASATLGTSLTDEQAKTAAAADRLGPVAYAANMTGFGPVGRLGMARDIAGGLAPAGSGLMRTIAGNMAGSAAEGASANYVSALGHGASPDQAAQQGLQGAAIGAPTGALSGILGRAFAGPGPTIPSAADLETTSKAGFAKAGNVLYDNADVRQAATNAIDEINQAPARIARNGQGALSALDKIGNNYALGSGAQSGEDLNDFIKSLKAPKTGDDVDVAGRIGQKHMQNILDNTTPVVSGGQVPGVPGAGATAINQANQAYGRSQDLARLQDSNLTQAMVKKTQGYWDPDTPEYQSLDALQKAMQPKFSWYGARHIAAPLVGAGLLGAGGYFYPAEGQSPYINAVRESLEGALLFKGLKAAAAPRPQGALNRAQYAVGTGQPYAAPFTSAPGDALRALILGQTAASSQ